MNLKFWKRKKERKTPNPFIVDSDDTPMSYYIDLSAAGFAIPDSQDTSSDTGFSGFDGGSGGGGGADSSYSDSGSSDSSSDNGGSGSD